MARQTKSKVDSIPTVTPTPEEVVVPEVVVPEVVVTEVVKEKKEKKPRASKKVSVDAPVTSVVEQSVVEPEPIKLEVNDSTTSNVEETTMEIPLSEHIEILSELQQVTVLISSIKNHIKVLEKSWSKKLKMSQKLNIKKKRKSVARKPSGFVKPTLISDELAHFLEKPTGSEMARTEVTKDINKYIRAHNLQDTANGRNINPDEKLSVLLKLTTDDKLTYFNLQKYMSHHFAKGFKMVESAV
jgi:chromatin remodeling complex protein RSC6